MALSPEALEHLCHLAKLSPDESSKERLARQCSDILNYMDTLAEVNTDNVQALYSPVMHENMLREDVAKVRQTPEKILANAPKTDGQYFIVPRIVEGK